MTNIISSSDMIRQEYEGNEISFFNNGNAWVNATQMASIFNKRPVDWLQNQNTSEFIEELAKVRNSTLGNLVKVQKGGNNPGTWMHEDVALEFARWLSPKFAIWTNDKIKELMRDGVATISNDDDVLAQAMKILNRRLEDNQRKLELAKQTIKEQAPKVQYCNKVLESVNNWTTTTIAAELGMSAKALNQRLKEFGVQRYADKHWVLNAKYNKQGYTESRTYSYQNSNGEEVTNISTCWTEKGRMFIHNIISQSLAKVN